MIIINNKSENELVGNLFVVLVQIRIFFGKICKHKFVRCYFLTVKDFDCDIKRSLVHSPLNQSATAV